MTTSSQLWSLHHDGRHHSVISASDEGRAWKIVQVLQDLGDVPAEPPIALLPTTPELARQVSRAAQTARIDEGFLAFMANGMFITRLCGAGLG
ncbi:hypothetical protein [Paramagnetospirillum kuznetsovii]|nr:hypothetical protein [Paramagnetospirillum kuznetsovii]